ncbi:MAG: hypothetical protein NTV62_01250 [Candidatus Gribaldobacteria bacterium]|nr:hypothetical protein [Candidatus Gribaldobacteria bacterium]
MIKDLIDGSPTVIDIASLNNGGKTLVLYRHPGELDPDYESQVTVSKVPLDYQNTPAVDEVFCSIPSRVAPRVLVDGDTENWFKIYQVASAKLLRLKDYLSTAGVLIENVNADPNDAGQYIGAISKIFNGTLDDQKYPDVLKWKTALGLIGDIKTDLGKLSTNDKNLRDNFESRCKTKIKDCAKYPCTVEEQKCSGTAYWQEYVWYDGRVITKGDPIPKDSCLVNITTINNAKKNGYQVDLMGVDWEARIENLILAVDNLNLMFQGLAYPGCTLAPCLSPTSSAILFEISGASAVVESKTDAFIKTVGDSSRCPTGALGKCNTFCGSTAFTKYKDRTACRDACKEFGTAGSARDACRQNCTDNCTTSKNSCSTSQCKDACKAGNSACSSGGVLASYKIQENLDSFVGNLTKIGNRLKEIQETWSTTSPGSPTADERPNFELDVAETYTWQVKRMIELSREINEKLLPDATKAWSNLQDAYNRLNSSGSVSQASLEAWKGIFVGDSITNKIDVLQKIEKLLGKKYVCDENDLGFLPQIKCFEEKKIQKNFDQLYNFFTKASVLEDALYFLTSPATSSVKRLVLGLEPMIDMAKDDGSGAKTVDEYFSSMTENPLSYIEKSFTKINQTQERVRQWFEFSMGGIKDFFHDAYQEPEKLVGTQSANLTRLVFGENDLRSACDSLKVVLDQNPQDFKAACLADYASLTSEGDLANQKETEKSCGQFGILMGALNNECDKISSTWSSYCKDQACGDNEDCVKSVKRSSNSSTGKID